MGKYSNEDKLKMINDACDLLNEARSKFRQAEKLLHRCGVVLCDTLESGDVPDWNRYGLNVQIGAGIANLERIIGATSTYPIDDITGRCDKSRKRIEYKGLVFLQVASEETSKYSFR